MMTATTTISTTASSDKCGQRVENCVSCTPLADDTINAVTQPHCNAAVAGNKVTCGKVSYDSEELFFTVAFRVPVANLAEISSPMLTLEASLNNAPDASNITAYPRLRTARGESASIWRK